MTDWLERVNAKAETGHSALWFYPWLLTSIALTIIDAIADYRAAAHPRV